MMPKELGVINIDNRGDQYLHVEVYPRRHSERQRARNYLIALGCAGWEAGQLEREIITNAWLTVPADPALIFSSDYKNKTQRAASILGVDLQQLAPGRWPLLNWFTRDTRQFPQ